MGSRLSFCRTSSGSTGVIDCLRLRSLMHSGAHPCGQVGWSLVGVKQPTMPLTGPSTLQQSWPD
jgi:hypothetical protein